MFVKKLTLLLALLLTVGWVAGCSDDDDDKGPDPQPTDQFEAVRGSLATYVESTVAPTINAADLFANLNDGNTANDPYVLSVRAAADFAKGHVPGAHNLYWKELAQPAKLATLPRDRQIVVYCYTGHTGAVSTTLLRSLGYQAVNMKFGIMAWTPNAEVRAQTPFREADVPDYAVETTAHEFGSATFQPPSLEVSDAGDVLEITRAAAEAYVSGTASPVISASALFANLNDGNTANDPLVLSVRARADYDKGHIPGAYNIPWRELTKLEKLEKLDPSREIVVYCYTGHTGGIATTALNMMGYKATNLKHGMCGWTKDATVRAVTPFVEFAEGAEGYPLETGD